MNFWCKIRLHEWRYKSYPIAFKEERICLKCGKHQSYCLIKKGSLFNMWKTIKNN
jgi:hypothetical protein